MFQSKFTNRDKSALNEATAHPVFLFQRRRWIITGIPDSYKSIDCEVIAKIDDDGKPIMNEDGDYVETLSDADLANYTHGEYSVPCAIETWETDRVFLTRQEAEEYGNARSYNYKDGWRVYSVNAQGELVTALRDGSEIDAKRFDNPQI